jgi:hypothetical protein
MIYTSISLPDRKNFRLAVVSATASVFVAGNLRHLPARVRGGVTVLTPREVLERIKSELRVVSAQAGSKEPSRLLRA